jgi:hypothetical protein
VADGASLLVHNLYRSIHAAALIEEFVAWQCSARDSNSVTLNMLKKDLQLWQLLYEQQSNSTSVKLVRHVMGNVRNTIRRQRAYIKNTSTDDCKLVIASWQKHAAESAERAQRQLQEVCRSFFLERLFLLFALTSAL